MPIFGTKTKVNTFNVSGNQVGVGGQDEMRERSSYSPNASAEDINEATAREQTQTGTGQGEYMGIPNVKKSAFDPNNLKTTAFVQNLNK